MGIRNILASTVLGDYYRALKYQYQCPICTARFVEFNPIDSGYLRTRKESGNVYKPEDCETLNMDNYSCPSCYATDRDRLYALYINKRLAAIPVAERLKLLEIAPSVPLRRFLKQNGILDYRCADLYREDVDDKVDIQDMPLYEDNAFDIFICSHVLEHVPDDIRAMLELRRILKPGGWGIMMVPINLKVKVIDEDPTITDAAEKWRRFGQDDHVRMYSRHGFLKRAKQSGFNVQIWGEIEFGAKTFKRAGITQKSKLYIVS